VAPFDLTTLTTPLTHLVGSVLGQECRLRLGH